MMHLFEKKFVFCDREEPCGTVCVTKDTLYSDERGYGFLTEKIRRENENLALEAVSNGFTLPEDSSLSAGILSERTGDNGDARDAYCYTDAADLPLYFRVKVPHEGNYHVKLRMGSAREETELTVFAERRRCVLWKAHADRGEFLELSYTANVCPVIPRHKESVYEDEAVDLTLVGPKTRINSVEITEAPEAPTVYLAGDSTVADQYSEYPYRPEANYCGWGQMLTMYLKEGIAVSNHAHSGLSTASFRGEGHWAILRGRLRAGDYLLIQFGHNDQKRDDCRAFEGYAKNLELFVEEALTARATPVIVTPVSRSVWDGPDGAFRDTLEDYTSAAKKVAQKKNIALLDLNRRSAGFLKTLGKEAAKRYFHPDDSTHFNDEGGRIIAKLLTEEIRESGLCGLKKYLR